MDAGSCTAKEPSLPVALYSIFDSAAGSIISTLKLSRFSSTAMSTLYCHKPFSSAQLPWFKSSSVSGATAGISPISLIRVDVDI